MPLQHALKFQCTIPASKTRTPMMALERISTSAAETLKRMVPYAYDVEFKRIYHERRTRKLGLVWDFLMVMQFNHRGPLPPNVLQLKLYYDIKRKTVTLQ